MDDAERERCLAHLYDAGRAAWPQIALERMVFDARVLDAVGGDTLSEALRGDDLYLAVACAEGIAGALDEFDRRYLARVPVFLARMRKPAAFVDDVTQRLREKLFLGSAEAPPRITRYAGRGSLDGWVSVVATRLALDVNDAEQRHRVADRVPDDEAFGATADPELAYIRQRHLPQFRAAFAEAMLTLSAEERNLLRFYLVDGLNIAQIGAMFGKGRSTIGRWLIDCRARILEATKAALAAELGAGDELTSLLRFLHSQLDVSVRGYLVDGP